MDWNMKRWISEGHGNASDLISTIIWLRPDSINMWSVSSSLTIIGWCMCLCYVVVCVYVSCSVCFEHLLFCIWFSCLFPVLWMFEFRLSRLEGHWNETYIVRFGLTDPDCLENYYQKRNCCIWENVCSIKPAMTAHVLHHKGSGCVPVLP